MKKIISLLVLICFFAEQSCFAQILPQVLPLYFSQPGFLIQDKFRPIHLRSIEFMPQSAGVQVLLDKGDSKELKQDILQEEAGRLMDYFLIGLTLPNDAFWVNLRPDQADNIIDPYLEKTDIGKVMLEADLNLKKDLAKATSPQTREGKEYWNKLYAKAQELFGDQQVSLPTFTRPWIVPGEMIIRQSPGSAYIYKATLKVMLEQDYLAGSVPRFADKRLKELNDYSSELIRRFIIPSLVLRVNSSRVYAPLRQVYHSLILSRWLKEKAKSYAEAARHAFRSSAMENYIDKIDTRDLTGLISKQPWSPKAYFDRYKRSLQNGEYNESRIVNTPSGQIIRQYSSGGISMTMPAGGMSVIYADKTFSSNGLAAVIVGRDGGEAGAPLQEMLDEKNHYKLVELSRRLGLDPRPVEYKFLHPLYIAHDMAVKKIVNPESLPLAALYFGARVDVVNLLLSTNAVRADFVSGYNGGLIKERLDELADMDINTNAQNRKRAFDYRDSKYLAGYGIGSYVQNAEELTIYLSAELKALGVDRTGIVVDTDKRGYPRITFDWAYPGEEPKKRAVCFIDSYDILQDRGIRYLDGYDIYYQRAAMELAAGYGEKRYRKNSYIRDVYARVKPGGYLVTDDYTWRFSFDHAGNYTADFPGDLAVESHPLDPLLTEAVRGLRRSQGQENMLGYGWDVSIRRKPPAAGKGRQGDGGQMIGKVKSLFGLEYALGFDMLEETEGDGFTVRRVKLPGSLADKKAQERIDLLRNELVRLTDFNLVSVDLLYRQGRLLAVFPVIQGDAARKLIQMPSREVRYLNLAPYYFTIPGFGMPGAREAWERFAKQLTEDMSAVYKYKNRKDSPVKYEVNHSQSPYFYVQVDKKNGEISVEELFAIDEDSYVSRMKWVPLEKLPGKAQLIVPVLPTVYSMARHWRSDDEYYRYIAGQADIREEDSVLVVGPGTGVELWIANLFSSRKKYAVGINPMEKENSELTARAGGFIENVEIITGDNIVSPDGKPRFGGVKFDKVFWNMPSYNPYTKERIWKQSAFLPMRGDILWDNDYEGRMLSIFSRGLSSVLSYPEGTAILWNETHLRDPGNKLSDIVGRILETGGAVTGVDVRARKIFDVSRVDPPGTFHYGSFYIVSRPETGNRQSAVRDGGAPPAQAEKEHYGMPDNVAQGGGAGSVSSSETSGGGLAGKDSVLRDFDSNIKRLISDKNIARRLFELYLIGIIYRGIDQAPSPDKMLMCIDANKRIGFAGGKELVDVFFSQGKFAKAREKAVMLMENNAGGVGYRDVNKWIKRVDNGHRRLARDMMVSAVRNKITGITGVEVNRWIEGSLQETSADYVANIIVEAFKSGITGINPDYVKQAVDSCFSEHRLGLAVGISLQALKHNIPGVTIDDFKRGIDECFVYGMGEDVAKEIAAAIRENMHGISDDNIKSWFNKEPYYAAAIIAIPAIKRQIPGISVYEVRKAVEECLEEENPGLVADIVIEGIRCSMDGITGVDIKDWVSRMLDISYSTDSAARVIIEILKSKVPGISSEDIREWTLECLKGNDPDPDSAFEIAAEAKRNGLSILTSDDATRAINEYFDWDNVDAARSMAVGVIKNNMADISDAEVERWINKCLNNAWFDVAAEIALARLPDTDTVMSAVTAAVNDLSRVYDIPCWLGFSLVQWGIEYNSMNKVPLIMEMMQGQELNFLFLSYIIDCEGARAVIDKLFQPQGIETIRALYDSIYSHIFDESLPAGLDMESKTAGFVLEKIVSFNESQYSSYREEGFTEIYNRYLSDLRAGRIKPLPGDLPAPRILGVKTTKQQELSLEARDYYSRMLETVNNALSALSAARKNPDFNPYQEANRALISIIDTELGSLQINNSQGLSEEVLFKAQAALGRKRELLMDARDKLISSKGVFPLLLLDFSALQVLNAMPGTNESMRLMLFIYALSQNEVYKDYFSLTSRQDSQAAIMRKMVELVNSFIKPHLLEDVKSNCRKQILSCANIGLFKKEIDRLSGGKADLVRRIRAVPTRGWIVEYIGYIADECWTRTPDILRDNPDTIGLLFQDEDTKELLGGTLLMSNSVNGEKVLIDRGFSPRVEVTAGLNMSSLMEEAGKYEDDIASAIGAKKILVPLRSLENGLGSNNPDVIQYYERVLGDEPTVDLDTSNSFNGHNITHGKLVIWREVSVKNDGGSNESGQKLAGNGSRLSDISGMIDMLPASGGGLAGIDFRNLPVAAQAPPGLTAPVSRPRIPLPELDKEWSAIRAAVDNGDIPCGSRIRDYLVSCCPKGDISADIDKVRVCISDILKLEEDYAAACEPGFIQFISVLESGKPAREMQEALNSVSFAVN